MFFFHLAHFLAKVSLSFVGHVFVDFFCHFLFSLLHFRETVILYRVFCNFRIFVKRCHCLVICLSFFVGFWTFFYFCIFVKHCHFLSFFYIWHVWSFLHFCETL